MVIVYMLHCGRQCRGVFRRLEASASCFSEFYRAFVQPLERDLDLDGGLLLLSGSSRL